MEPSEGPHPGPIAGPGKAAGQLPGGRQRPAELATSSQGGGPAPGSEPDTTAVTAALASLRREDRQVIVCTFYEHLSADDVAARLGISVRDVKRRACSALDEICRILEERGVQVPRPAGTLPATWSDVGLPG